MYSKDPRKKESHQSLRGHSQSCGSVDAGSRLVVWSYNLMLGMSLSAIEDLESQRGISDFGVKRTDNPLFLTEIYRI
jgi:hypothetical protein